MSKREVNALSESSLHDAHSARSIVPPPVFETPAQPAVLAHGNITTPPGYTRVGATLRREPPLDRDGEFDLSPNPLSDDSLLAPSVATAAGDSAAPDGGSDPDGAGSKGSDDSKDDFGGPPRRPPPGWDLWADHDRGASGLLVTRGFSASSKASELMLLASGQLPVKEIAYELRKIGGCKEELATVYRIAVAMGKYRRDICDPLCEATTLLGSTCRSKIDDAASLLFGSEEVHSAVCYAIMISIWSSHEKSTKRDIISACVTDYMHTVDSQVVNLLECSATGRTLNATLMVTSPMDLPGMARLDPYRCSSFGTAWRDLWVICVNVLCGIIRSGEVDEALTSWEITSPKHPLVAKRYELVQSVLARHITAVQHITSMADRFSMKSRSPDDYRLGANFLKAFVYRKNMLCEFEEFLRKERQFADGLTLANVVEVLEIVQNRSTVAIPALSAVRKMAPGESDRSGASRPTSDKPSDRGGSHNRRQGGPSRGKDQLPPIPFIVGYATAEVQVNGKSYLPNPNTKPSKEERERRSGDPKVCTNCGFDDCHQTKCPFARYDGRPLHQSHEPMAATKEMLASLKGKLMAAHLLQDPSSAPDAESPEEQLVVPLMALGFPDEPALPDGIFCGGVLLGSSAVQSPCLLEEGDDCDSPCSIFDLPCSSPPCNLCDIDVLLDSRLVVQALENYERFHQLPDHCASLPQVMSSSAGLSGWVGSMPFLPVQEPVDLCLGVSDPPGVVDLSALHSLVDTACAMEDVPLMMPVLEVPAQSADSMDIPVDPPVVYCLPECRAPSCSRPVFVEPDGRAHPFCSRGCATFVRDPLPICRVPSCSRPVYVEEDGRVHNYCSRQCSRHDLNRVGAHSIAREGIPLPVCYFPDCTRTVWVEPSGFAHPFCGRLCADNWKSLRSRQVLACSVPCPPLPRDDSSDDDSAPLLFSPAVIASGDDLQCGLSLPLLDASDSPDAEDEDLCLALALSVPAPCAPSDCDFNTALLASTESAAAESFYASAAQDVLMGALAESAAFSEAQQLGISHADFSTAVAASITTSLAEHGLRDAAAAVESSEICVALSESLSSVSTFSSDQDAIDSALQLSLLDCPAPPRVVGLFPPPATPVLFASADDLCSSKWVSLLHDFCGPRWCVAALRHALLDRRVLFPRAGRGTNLPRDRLALQDSINLAAADPHHQADLIELAAAGSDDGYSTPSECSPPVSPVSADREFVVSEVSGSHDSSWDPPPLLSGDSSSSSSGFGSDISRDTAVEEEVYLRVPLLHDEFLRISMPAFMQLDEEVYLRVPDADAPATPDPVWFDTTAPSALPPVTPKPRGSSHYDQLMFPPLWSFPDDSSRALGSPGSAPDLSGYWCGGPSDVSPGASSSCTSTLSYPVVDAACCRPRSRSVSSSSVDFGFQVQQGSKTPCSRQRSRSAPPSVGPRNWHHVFSPHIVKTSSHARGASTGGLPSSVQSTGGLGPRSSPLLAGVVLPGGCAPRFSCVAPLALPAPMSSISEDMPRLLADFRDLNAEFLAVPADVSGSQSSRRHPLLPSGPPEHSFGMGPPLAIAESWSDSSSFMTISGDSLFVPDILAPSGPESAPADPLVPAIVMHDFSPRRIMVERSVLDDLLHPPDPGSPPRSAPAPPLVPDHHAPFPMWLLMVHLFVGFFGADVGLLVHSSLTQCYGMFRSAYTSSTFRVASASVVVIILLLWLGVAIDSPIGSHEHSGTCHASSAAPWQVDRMYAMPVVAPSAASRFTSRVEGYVAHTPSGHPIVVGPDTMADITMIDPAKVDPSWPRRTVNTVNLRGIGAASLCEVVEVPLHHQWGSIPDVVSAYIGSTPPGVDMILGVDALDSLDSIIDRTNHTIMFRAKQLLVFLSPFAEIRRRQSLPPQRVLATNAGCNFVYCTFRNLGIKVKSWHSVESDPKCRSIASQIVPPSELTHLAPHDTTMVADRVRNSIYDIMIDTSPCPPWSRLHDCPKCKSWRSGDSPPPCAKTRGFGDDRSKTFLAAAAIYRILLAANPHLQFLVENVEPHAHLRSDLARMESLWGSPFRTVNAADWGSPSSRPRNLCTNIVDVASVPTRQPTPSQWFLPDDVYCDRRLMRCIIASEDTHYPPVVRDSVTSQPRRLHVSESEVFQLWPKGITDGSPSNVNLSRSDRIRMVGNAVNGAHMFHVFKHLRDPHLATLTMCPATIHEKTADQIELYLSNMSDSSMDAWFAHRFEGYQLLKLSLRLKASHLPPAKPKSTYSVPAGLIPSMEYCLSEQCRLKRMRKVAFSNQFFISKGFIKSKERLVEGTSFTACRPLGDFRALNDACEPPPAHWAYMTNDQQSLCLSVPLGMSHFCYYDLDSAHHTVELCDKPLKPSYGSSDRSDLSDDLPSYSTLDLVIVNYNGSLYQYLGAAQGIASIGLFWPVHLHDGFFHALGRHWESWFTAYVDDLGVWADSEQRALNRGRILEALLRSMNKPFSQKQGASGGTVDSHMILAGLHFDSEGVKIDDTAIELLRYTLHEHPVPNVKEAQHVVGVIQYCNSAFVFDTSADTHYTHLLAVLIEAVTRPPPFVWGDNERAACKQLCGCICNLPRAFMRPSDLIGPDVCFIAMTDASDTAVAISLFLVFVADAAQVTEADLKSSKKSRLVAMKYKKLNSAQRRWNTFEVELYGMVRVVTTYGGIITVATAQYPPGSGKPSKIGFWCDSTTAIGQMPSLSLPIGTIDHLSAKARRFFSWADKVAGTRYWSYVLLHFPGDSISLPHMMTHMGDMALQRRDEMRQAQASFIVFPMTLSSPSPLVAPCELSPPSAYSVPSGYIASHLTLVESESSVIAAAYQSDASTFLSIPLSDIYAVVTSSAPVPKLHLDRVRPWVGVRFFAIAPPGCDTPLLYTPTSFQVIEATDEDASLRDPTRTLVLVVPAGAMVRITDAARQPAITTHESHPEYGHWMQHDLRRDILYLAHNNNDHPSLAHTLRSMREMCWFPQIVQYTKYHVQACPICTPRVKAQRAIGASIIAAHRLWVVYIDHFILEGDLPSITGVGHILTMLCSRTRFAMFIVVASDSAVATATAIHNRWYPFLGVPVIFKSDRGPGFASKCMAAFRTMMGVKKWLFSAADDPLQHSLLEHKHKLLKDVLLAAEAKGDIKSRDDLEFYVASANGRQNLHSSSHDAFTPFECLTGQQPRAISSMALTSDLTSVPAEIDRSFLSTLRYSIDNEHRWSAEQRDEIARANTLRRDFTEGSSKSVPTSFVVGSKVSLHGFQVTILDLLCVTPSGPSKAKVEYSSGKTDVVNHHDLKPLCDPTSELMAVRDIALSPDMFIFFDSSDGLTHGGIILAVNDPPGFIKVHDCEGNASVVRKYTPLYSYPDRPDPVKHSKPPKDTAAVPIVLSVAVENVLISGRISKSHMIDKSLLDYLASLGTVMTPLMMPAMLDDLVPSITELSVLRSLLSAAGLNPFGSISQLRARVCSLVLGISTSDYVFDAVHFTSLATSLRSFPACRIPVDLRCVSLMSARLAARQSPLPPTYAVATSTPVVPLCLNNSSVALPLELPLLTPQSSTPLSFSICHSALIVLTMVMMFQLMLHIFFPLY